MTNRREFLQVSMLASTLPLISHPAGANSKQANSPDVLGYYKFIYDARHSDSTALAGYLQNQGLGTQALSNGDITPFWYKELSGIWAQSPVPVAGMTRHGPLFCLEQLAWQYGMRVVFKATHTPRPGTLLQHELNGPEALVSLGRSGPYALGKLDGRWTEGIGELMLSCPTGQCAIETAQVLTPLSAEPDFQPIPDEILYSWVIAPARKQEVSA